MDLQRQGERVVLREWAWETRHEILGSPPPARGDESSFPKLSPWSSLKTLILQPPNRAVIGQGEWGGGP